MQYEYDVRGFFDFGQHGFQTAIHIVKKKDQPPEAKFSLFCHAKRVEDILGRLSDVLFINSKLTQSEKLAPNSSIRKVTIVFSFYADTLDTCRHEIDNIIEKTDHILELIG